MSSPESTGKFKREMEGQFPGRPIGPTLIPQAPADFIKVNRRKRCGNCEACKIKENCNTCKNCLNRKILKQTCILRRCHFLHHKSSSANDVADGKRKRLENRNLTCKKSCEDLETMKVVSVPEETEEVRTDEKEANISSSDEIEQAVNSLLEDSNKYAQSEEEVCVPDKIIVRQRPLMPKIVKRPDSVSSINRHYNPKSFPESSEVLKSSSLLNKQNDSFEGSRVSFKITPPPQQPAQLIFNTNGASLTPGLSVPGGPQSAYQIPGLPMQGPVMIMNPPGLQKHYSSEIPRQNIVFARIPGSSQPINAGAMFPQRSGPLSSEDMFNSHPKMPETSFHCLNAAPPHISSGSFGSDFGTPKVHRRKRCGQCRPCQIKENCMKCKNCLNRKVLKQTCVHRKCLFLREKMRKESGFCSSPIVDTQPVQQTPPASQQQFMGQMFDGSVNPSSQHIQLQPAVFIAEHYDQSKFRPMGQSSQKPLTSEISLSGQVNIIPQGHVIQHGQHIQLWQNPYSGTTFHQGLPMIATPQGNYAVQLRPQHQLGGYVQAQMMNPSDHQPRYYMHPGGPALAHMNPLHELAPISRLNNPRPISLPPVEQSHQSVADKTSIECKDFTPSSSQ